ncbi:MAG: hypothetical protein M3380_09630, partial [Chloroflexota bacterium]|nr:hypothetical protein [Chloroflexota bacterium]
MDMEQRPLRPAVAPQPPVPPAPGVPPPPSRPVPERPVLAPTVQLCGAMTGTGFAAQQWLVQRDGHFLQLTEWLYRILEHANGQRTLDEIAANVAAATGDPVSAADVRQLIATKLLPSGLVAPAEGGPAAAPRAAPASRSPLAVNLRWRVLSPHHIEPLTRVL